MWPFPRVLSILPLAHSPKRSILQDNMIKIQIKNGVLINYTGHDTNVIIPDNVTKIGDRVFFCCSCPTSITIPNSVTKIGNYVFYNCYNLLNVTIGNSITSISARAFSECSSLTNIIIPDSVIAIGDRAFSGCSNLINVVIPKNTILGNNVFDKCTNLKHQF